MNYMNFEAGGNTYKLVLTTRAMVELEKKIGCNPLDILVKVQSEESLPKVYDMVAIIWASLLKFNHGIKFDDCYDIFDDYLNEGHAITDFLEVMLEIFKVSGLIKEDKRGPRPKRKEGGGELTPPLTLTELAEQTLETALDIGIDEDTYWNMSIGEVARRVESYERTYQRKLKDKASFDWTLGNLIGMSIGRCLDSDATYPEIYEAYPTIFSSEEVEELKQKEQDERSVANFLAFATAHNLMNKMKEGGNVSG